MGPSVRSYASVCLRLEHLRRTAAIALLVGSWLTLYNQGEVLLSTGISAALAVKILLNYLTPFVVSNWGLVSRKMDHS